MARTKQGSPTKAIGYLRVSTEEQSLGPVAQRESLEKWANANNVTLVAVFQEEVSGGAELDKRTQLLAAVDSLKSHGAGILIVAKRDRLARDTMLAAMIERLVERAGGTIRSSDGVGNGTGPESQLLRGMIDLFAQYERALIKSRTKAALAVKKSRGQRTGQIPYGYQLATDGVALQPNQAEQATVTLIFSLRSEGLTLAGIANKLNLDGIPARGKKWHTTTITRILKAA